MDPSPELIAAIGYALLIERNESAGPCGKIGYSARVLDLTDPALEIPSFEVDHSNDFQTNE